VLNVFIRVNSGGTVLNHSDLLLSIATSQWKELDAREAVHGLVDELNGIGQGFSFDKDMILKSGLMLNDIPSVAFQVRNFNTSNMSKLEASWDRVAEALRQTVRLLADFGFSERTLSARSVVIPVAYYLYKRQVPESYFTHDSQAADRAAIRTWVTRSLIKPGVWGSGLDQLLVVLRHVIAEHGADRFPAAELEGACPARQVAHIYRRRNPRPGDDVVQRPEGVLAPVPSVSRDGLQERVPHRSCVPGGAVLQSQAPERRCP
jgi:hypothetical protein